MDCKLMAIIESFAANTAFKIINLLVDTLNCQIGNVNDDDDEKGSWKLGISKIFITINHAF